MLDLANSVGPGLVVTRLAGTGGSGSRSALVGTDGRAVNDLPRLHGRPLVSAVKLLV